MVSCGMLKRLQSQVSRSNKNTGQMVKQGSRASDKYWIKWGCYRNSVAKLCDPGLKRILGQMFLSVVLKYEQRLWLGVSQRNISDTKNFSFVLLRISYGLEEWAAFSGGAQIMISICTKKLETRSICSVLGRTWILTNVIKLKYDSNRKEILLRGTRFSFPLLLCLALVWFS